MHVRETVNVIPPLLNVDQLCLIIIYQPLRNLSLRRASQVRGEISISIYHAGKEEGRRVKDPNVEVSDNDKLHYENV